MVAIVGLEPAAVMGSASTYCARRPRRRRWQPCAGRRHAPGAGRGRRLGQRPRADAAAREPTRARSASSPVRRPTTSARGARSAGRRRVSRHRRGRPHGHAPRRREAGHAAPPRSCRTPPCPARSRSPAPASRSCCFADAQTAGGYPKIATVIGAPTSGGSPRCAPARCLRFAAVTPPRRADRAPPRTRPGADRLDPPCRPMAST